MAIAMDSRPRILVVDDEPSIRLFLAEELAMNGYDVLVASSGEQALVQMEIQPVDLVLLDLKMGGIDGLQVMAELEQGPLAPQVILLTAHASLDSAIEVMRRGGCDYLLKPCRTGDLLAAVERALGRRRDALREQQLLHLIETSVRQLQRAPQPTRADPASPPRFLESQGLLLDRDRRSITLHGRPVRVTPAEFRLLLCLMERADQVVPFGDLMQALHGVQAEKWESRQAISTHLWRLRAKLGNTPDGTPYLINVRGEGYCFSPGKPVE